MTQKCFNINFWVTSNCLLNYLIFVENKQAFMKQLLTILLLGLCLVACNRHSEHWKTITDMERIIEERPDSVLNVLQAIDTDKLVGDEETAKHALLLSMALIRIISTRPVLRCCSPPLTTTRITARQRINSAHTTIKVASIRTQAMMLWQWRLL